MKLIKAKEYIVELEDELLEIAGELKECRTRLLKTIEENDFLRMRIKDLEESKKDKAPF